MTDITEKEEQIEISHYTFLWEQLNTMAFNTTNRNFNTLNLSSLIAGAALILTCTIESESFFNYSVFVIPAIILIVFFYNAQNNKIEAILKGYLSGIEEVINAQLGKNLFQWNGRYIQIYRIPYFLTNDSAGIMFFLIAGALVVLSFIKMFQFDISDNLDKAFYLVLIILYLIVFIVFATIFAIDTFTNGKTSKISHDYFISNYNDPQFISNQQRNSELLKTIYNQLKANKNNNKI